MVAAWVTGEGHSQMPPQYTGFSFSLSPTCYYFLPLFLPFHFNFLSSLLSVPLQCSSFTLLLFFNISIPVSTISFPNHVLSFLPPSPLSLSPSHSLCYRKLLAKREGKHTPSWRVTYFNFLQNLTRLIISSHDTKSRPSMWHCLGESCKRRYTHEHTTPSTRWLVGTWHRELVTSDHLHKTRATETD